MKKGAKIVSLPFSVNHGTKGRLSDLVADGIRQAIFSGRYAEGDVLPNRDEMATALGVSVRAVRGAVAKLTAEGLVHARPSIGCVVNGSGDHTWRGHVLYVSLDTRSVAYGHMASSQTFIRCLAEAGYLVSTVSYSEGADGRCETSKLETALRQSVDLVVLPFARPALRKVVRKARVPFVFGDDLLQGDPCESAIADLAEHCRQAGVKSVTLFAICHPRYCGINPIGALQAAGVTVRVRHASFPSRNCESWLEDVERAGMNLVIDEFGGRRRKLPDLVVFLDDFLAVGGIPALQHLGIGIPGDLRLVTLSNRGFGPVFPVPLTKIEVDPFRTGEVLAEAVIARLNGDDAAVADRPEARYIEGKTFE